VPPKPKVPIWVFGVVALCVLLLVGGLTYLVWPKGNLDPALVQGKTVAEAVTIAAANGFANIGNTPGKAMGYDPGLVMGVAKASDGEQVLLTDPGVPIPPVHSLDVIAAVQQLASVGIVVASPPQFEGHNDIAANSVVRTDPPEGTAVKLGQTIAMVVAKPLEGGNGGDPGFRLCIDHPEACVIELQPQFRRRIEEIDQLNQ
jgi:hypothetical protein